LYPKCFILKVSTLENLPPKRARLFFTANIRGNNSGLYIPHTRDRHCCVLIYGNWRWLSVQNREELKGLCSQHVNFRDFYIFKISKNLGVYIA
jgi:hypothetical protein